MDWLTDFIADFDGPAWATLIVSVAAVVVSIIAIARTRPSKPHWELTGVREVEHNQNSLLTFEEDDGEVYPGDTYWMVGLRQCGPGSAESVRTQVRTPDGHWWSEQRVPDVEVGRGAELDLFLCSGKKIVGEYSVKVSYRQLPNTRRVRVWEKSFNPE